MTSPWIAATRRWRSRARMRRSVIAVWLNSQVDPIYSAGVQRAMLPDPSSAAAWDSDGVTESAVIQIPTVNENNYIKLWRESAIKRFKMFAFQQPWSDPIPSDPSAKCRPSRLEATSLTCIWSWMSPVRRVRAFWATINRRKARPISRKSTSVFLLADSHGPGYAHSS